MAETGYQTERLDHLGIVAGVCCEIEQAAGVDVLDVRQPPQDEKVAQAQIAGYYTVGAYRNGIGASCFL
jgi:hypothetical protein